MKGIRWRIILVLIVILVALFKIYPTLKWASLTKERKEVLKKQWEKTDKERNESIDFWGLPKEERQRQTAEFAKLNKPAPPKPSFFRNIGIGFKKWWQGDEEQILSLGLDLMGGIRIELDVEEVEWHEVVFEKLMNRIDAFGVKEPDIRKTGATGISIELPGATDIERARRLIEEQAVMQWMLVEENLLRSEGYSAERLQTAYDSAVKELMDKYEGKKDKYGNPIQWTFKELDKKLHDDNIIPEGVILRIYESKDLRTGRTNKIPLLLRSTPDEPEIVKGEDLNPNSIRRSIDETNMRPVINFQIRGEASKRFAAITREYNEGTTKAIPVSIDQKRGWRLAILIDNKVITAPAIRSEILGGSGQITGLETIAEADNQVIQLRSGSLPVKPTIISIMQVGPRLGADSIKRGVRSAIMGLLFVIIFMVIYYRKSGAVAVTALALNILLLLAAMAALGATLTLPGIAGIILTIGMAVDANVLIHERMREEIASGKNIRAAIAAGYDKAFSAILDSNITTLITAAILYKIGTGPVKGFAVTLTIGIAVSMFTALFVTRLIYEIIMRIKPLSNLNMFQLFKQTNIDFAKLMNKAVIVSLIIILVGTASLIVRFKDMLGIDFSGGTELRMVFDEDVDVGKIRDIVQKDLKINDAQVRYFDVNEGKRDKVSVHTKGKITEDFANEIEKRLETKFAEGGVSITEVGATHAAAMMHKAVIAVILAFIGIIIYVWLRFEFLFGIAGVLALVHDVLVTIGVFSGLFIFGYRELSLTIVAAILTIIGYSINDTVVIFDRIREDLKIMKRLDLKTIINTAVNQTLSRTILTTFTTLLVVLSLLFFGGQAVNDFAFTMLIGCLSGIYSTVFIAAPILLLFHRKSRQPVGEKVA